jgi:hypothetical protein
MTCITENKIKWPKIKAKNRIVTKISCNCS